jgi:translation initiation factor 1
MSKDKTVWSDEWGDMRKKTSAPQDEEVDISNLKLELRRLTSGKGRSVVEIKGLPNNKKFNKDLAKQLKKSLGVGGAFKKDYIEVHGEKLEEVKSFLDGLSIKWKQVGG